MVNTEGIIMTIKEYNDNPKGEGVIEILLTLQADELGELIKDKDIPKGLKHLAFWALEIYHDIEERNQVFFDIVNDENVAESYRKDARSFL